MPKLALISTAHAHTGDYIERIRHHQDGRSIGVVWDDYIDRGERFAALAHALFQPSLDVVLRDKSIEGFVILSETAQHLPLLAKILPTGKPVFCEKPLLVSDAEIPELQALLKQHPTALISGYHHPFTADLQSIRAAVSSGELGPCKEITFRFTHTGARQRWFDHPHMAWHASQKLAGGGAWIDLGTHAIHALHTLFGPITSTWCHLSQNSGSYKEVEDTAVAHVLFKSGGSARILASWADPEIANGLTLKTESAQLTPSPSGYVFRRPNGTTHKINATQPAQPDRIDRLIATVRGELSPSLIAEDLAAALHTVAITSAGYRSAARDAWEDIPNV